MMKIDESDETDELAPDKAKIYRPCTGIFSHISLLSVSMQSEVLLRPCHDPRCRPSLPFGLHGPLHSDYLHRPPRTSCILLQMNILWNLLRLRLDKA